MITTKTIKPDIKEIFILGVKKRLKKLLWILIVFLILILYEYISKPNDNSYIFYLFILILFPVLFIYRMWKSIISAKKRIYFRERYHEIDKDKLSIIYIDGSLSTITINNFKEIKRIKKGYELTMNDSRSWFIPFYTFNSYDDLSYFETEIADKINRNNFFKQNPIQNINVDFSIPNPPLKYSKKKRRHIKLGIIVVVLGCFMPFFHTCIRSLPSMEIGNTKYLIFVKDSIRKDIDTTHTTDFKSYDNYFYQYYYNTSHHFWTRNKDTAYYIEFWEFKDLKKADFTTTKIKYNTLQSEFNIKWGSSTGSRDSLPFIKEKYGYEFTNSKLNVNVDSQTKINKTIDSTNYKGFFGKVNMLSLNDEKGNPQMVLKYRYPKKMLLLLYKTNQSFIIIKVTCNHDEAINENVLNFFNLK